MGIKKLIRNLEKEKSNMQINWYKIDSVITYVESITIMNEVFNKVLHQKANDSIILFSCEKTYTYTVNCTQSDLKFLNKENIPLIKTNRGGKLTYHGPGQRMVYPILNLNNYKKDVKWYVSALEQWIINTLRKIKIPACKNQENIGVWVINEHNRKEKITSVGIRIKNWVTQHGVCINIFKEDLKYFNTISACGINNCPVASCDMFYNKISKETLDSVLKCEFSKTFGTRIVLNEKKISKN